jgi:hypothetical protein
MSIALINPVNLVKVGKNMKNTAVRLLAGLALFAMYVATAQATPLRMDYSVTDLGGGLYDYEFQLVLDNNDGTWSAGQGWRWIVFGDAPVAPSPLSNFVGDISDLPVGPYSGYGTSTGTHNGLTLESTLSYWIPTGIGDFLAWSGTSNADLIQGELLFSTLTLTLNNGVAANYEAANRIESVPAPATLALMGLGLAGIGFARKKRPN